MKSDEMAVPKPTPAERIRLARAAAAISQAELARRLGWHRQRVYAIESGREGPALERVYEIAVALGVDPNSFDERLMSIRPASAQPQG